MISLREIDCCILRELLQNGRKSVSTIAKQYGTSTDVIWKHYKELEKAGIIAGATIQYNYPLFDYKGVASLLLNVEYQHISEVLERLMKNPDIHASRVYNSIYNIAIITTFKSLKELESVKERFTRQNSVVASRIYLWTDVRNIPENLLLGGASFTQRPIMENRPKKAARPSKVKLDNTDMQIVEKLSSSGRAPFSRIAKSLGVSTDTVSRRYDALLENDYIKVCVQINPLMLGYSGLLSFYVAFASESKKQAIESIAEIPDVSYLAKISGEYDMQVAVLVRQVQNIYEINEKIMQISGIRKIEVDIRRIPPRWPGPKQYISTF